MINDPINRLGVNGVHEIKAHPFFFGVDWKRLREKRPPYVPEVSFIELSWWKLNEK